MRRVFAWTLLAVSPMGCAAGPQYAASNSVKMTQAAAFAGAAALATVVQSAMEARARNNAPVSHSGVTVTPQCDNEGLYPCVSVARSPSDPALAAPPEPEMSDEEARAYVLDFINGVRRLNDIGLLLRDPALDTFAQAESDQLSSDPRPGQHGTDHAGDLPGVHAELQASPEASPERLLQDRIGAILLGWMQEKPDGEHRGILMRGQWRRMGVGITSRAGHTYFTVDFSS